MIFHTQSKIVRGYCDKKTDWQIPDIYMKSGDVFPSGKDFHAVLRKSENKIRLNHSLT